MNCFIVFFNKTYIVFKENLPVTGRVLEEEKCKYFHNVDFKFKVIIPTQDKNQLKAGFCPSGFIIFGQQKTCAPVRIFT